MNTETKTKYVEPVGFKGSKGEWSVKETKPGIFPSVFLGGGTKFSFYQKPRIIINETYPAHDGVHEATAKLIAQSKEMAKALQMFIDHCEKSNSNKFFFEKEIAFAKQTLKNAGL